MNIHIRDIRHEDFDSIFKINQESIPHVFSLDHSEFSLLLKICEYSRVAEIGNEIAGYLFVLGKGLTYDGEEYNWFCNNLKGEFLYIDQVAIANKWKGVGCGRKLYKDLESYTIQNCKNVLVCEINYEPFNEVSMAFHRKLGFKELSRIETRGIIVSLQIKRGLVENV